MWQPSCHHVWMQVIVPLEFFIVKTAKQFPSAWVAFTHGLKSRTHIGYRTVNHAVTINVQIVPNDQAKSEGTITHLHKWQSIWPLLHNVNTGVKKRANFPFKIPWLQFTKPWPFPFGSNLVIIQCITMGNLPWDMWVKYGVFTTSCNLHITFGRNFGSHSPSNCAIFSHSLTSPKTALNWGWLMSVVNHLLTLPNSLRNPGSNT